MTHPEALRQRIAQLAPMHTCKEIAALIGLTPTQVYGVMRYLRISAKYARGDKYDVRGILRDYETGTEVCGIATKYGCSPSHVSWLVRKHKARPRGRGFNSFQRARQAVA
jgi:transposase-like protein